jgi:hypothetical protein
VGGGEAQSAQPAPALGLHDQPTTQGFSSASAQAIPDDSERWKCWGGVGMDATELRWSESEGRHLVAALPICKGQAVLCEAAHIALLLGDHRKTVCLHSTEAGACCGHKEV